MSMHIIYHKNCLDGLTAAAVCALYARHKRVGATYTAANYGEAFDPATCAGKRVYIVDFSFPPTVMDAICAVASTVMVMDHHKTAIAALDGWTAPENARMILDETRCGARLAFEQLRGTMESTLGVSGLNRLARFVAAVDDRDRWVWALEQTKEMNAAGYDNTDLAPLAFAEWITTTTTHMKRLAGTHIVRQQDKLVERLLRTSYMTEQTDGNRTFHVAVANSSVMQSEVGNALLGKYPDADFACVWYETHDTALGAMVRRLSFRSEDSRTDVSAIAAILGGGGHRNAAGATVYTGETL